MAKVSKSLKDGDITPETLQQLVAALARLRAGINTYSESALEAHRAQRAGEWMATPADGNTRQFIQLEQRFVHQFAKYAAAFPHLKEYAAREKMRLSADLLLSCSPDSISLQLSNEGSIFYTVRKYDITIYFDHYLCEQYDGRDETLITVFKKDDKILELAGTLEATALKLSTILASESISFPTFA